MKSYLDYGAFTPIQVAAVAALNGPQDCVAEMRTLYRERRRRAGAGAARRRVGHADRPKARCSPGRRSRRNSPISAASNSASCCWRAPSVAVAPGIGFGEHGDGHVRIALVENVQRLRQAVRSIRGFLQAGSNTTEEAPGTIAALNDASA